MYSSLAGQRWHCWKPIGILYVLPAGKHVTQQLMFRLFFVLLLRSNHHLLFCSVNQNKEISWIAILFRSFASLQFLWNYWPKWIRQRKWFHSSMLRWTFANKQQHYSTAPPEICFSLINVISSVAYFHFNTTNNDGWIPMTRHWNQILRTRVGVKRLSLRIPFILYTTWTFCIE
jgi:hypothetical protein